MGTLIHLQLQKLDFKGKTLFAFSGSPECPLVAAFCEGGFGRHPACAVRHADRVFCGHTHQAQFCERDGVAYYNSGSWTDFPPTYLNH